MTEQSQLSGFLLIDKPEGITSFDVIRHLRQQTGIRKFGHAGTLDPFATGLLIIAVNNFTRLLHLLESADKQYTATLILGTETSTGDPEGEIVSTSEAIITNDNLAVLKPDILQVTKLKPPLHSAVKVNGKRAYARARANEEFELPERDARIYEFDIVEFDFPRLVYSCRVSKGTYIRSLSQWIAARLGTIGYTKELRRTAIGKVIVQKAISLSETTSDTIKDQMVSVLDILPELESLTLAAEELARLRNGNFVPNAGADNQQLLIFDESGSCRGISFRKGNLLRPRVNL